MVECIYNGARGASGKFTKDGHMSNHLPKEKGHMSSILSMSNMWQKKEEKNVNRWGIISAKGGHGGGN